MKKKITILVLCVLSSLCLAVGLSACENQHTHIIGKREATTNSCTQNGNTEYWYCATCKQYFSDAGAKHTIPLSDTVISANGHDFENGECTVCHAPQDTDGLTYTLSEDETHYSCSGIGSATETDIVIADWYQGKRVVDIDSYAFKDCAFLTSVTVGKHVSYINNYAFENCSSLTSITFSEGIKGIGHIVFKNCINLTNINVASENTVYHSAGNCLIDTERKELIVGCKTSVIPADDSVKMIGFNAFYGCNSLTDISIPNTVTTIDLQAFGDCSNLTSVIIPNSVKTIRSSAFENCISLKSVTLPDGIRSIERYTFYQCSSLETITIPYGVSRIEEKAFGYCESLTSVTLPNTVTIIGRDAFRGCRKLTGITIPYRVTNIEESAFDVCTSLTDVTIENGVRNIGRYSFYACHSLKNITIPSSVNSIGHYAFGACRELTDIHFLGTKEQWNAITKDANWNGDIKSCTIRCTDGDIQIGE